MEPLSDALCQAAQWLKSSVETPSENPGNVSVLPTEKGAKGLRSTVSSPLEPPNGRSKVR
jgi:hypothetical protein